MMDGHKLTRSGKSGHAAGNGHEYKGCLEEMYPRIACRMGIFPNDTDFISKAAAVDQPGQNQGSGNGQKQHNQRNAGAAHMAQNSRSREIVSVGIAAFGLALPWTDHQKVHVFGGPHSSA